MLKLADDTHKDTTISKEGHKVAMRWTEKLVQEGFTAISTTFLENYAALTISSPEAILIVHLMSFKWDSRHPFPSLTTLARRMGISTTAVRSHARSLEKKGFLHRLQRQGSTNEFDLTPLFVSLEASVKN